MGGLVGFLFFYVLGGITFIPLLLVAVLIDGYFRFPVVREHTASRDSPDSTILRPGDDLDAIKNAQKALGDKFHARDEHDGDVAAGYFAVCREYIPGGAGGKPPERTTPLGSTTVAAQSPSVYQSMYRSIFDRKQNNSPLDNKSAGRPQKKGGNVFYVVLRHGHLILFDDDEQLEVRHVVSLAHHDVSIYSGGDETPEGELFIKRNAVCLSRKSDAGELTPDGKASKPFYLFSENCSEKEDFYFSLLRNQEQRLEAKNNPPKPLQFDVKDIIKLVQRLHSSEEHLQTRWLNAIIGRLFLALYKTSEVENFIRAKITKKISRVKTPSFLSKIALRTIDLGEAAPVITNPRLKELTVDGELVVEADCKYSGNFKLEVAATARIELGSRFKAREVNLILAVLLKRMEGHVMLRIKPPPSNRFWITFETMPKIDMTIEPIVSSRQITYTLILRQIENRIKEVIAESLVFPNWDDSPFYDTEGKLWRGGIWADDRVAVANEDSEDIAAEHGDVETVETLEGMNDESIMALPQMEKSASMPPAVDSSTNGVQQRKGIKSPASLSNIWNNASSSSVETQSVPEKPRALRSGSFVNASSPVAITDTTNADAFIPSTPPEKSHAAAAMAAISAANSPISTPIGSPLHNSRMEKPGSRSSNSSNEFLRSDAESQNGSTPQASASVSDTQFTHDGPRPSSPSNASLKSEAPSSKSLGSFSWDRNSRREDSSGSSVKSNEGKRISLAAVAGAAAQAKTWGWNALKRNGDQKPDVHTDEPDRPRVMGRGQPLPPPGVPLPRPDKKTKTAPIAVPKRKPMPPPAPEKQKENTGTNNTRSPQRHAVPPPPLPKRRSIAEGKQDHHTDDGLLVVSAPMTDSEPTTPINESPPSYMPPWVEDAEELGEVPKTEPTIEPPKSSPKSPPRLPKRRTPHRVLSSSPEEDGHNLPSWMAAQEEEARAKNTFIEDEGDVYER
ncbi:hypothetical protein GLAREA_11994 [Glarea lozoyensis ATCC 20868]|uniref:SMP-LTD domain-containing protein n=1 Tax=Glarea lozoyensis (strain ATCC 20868 / MF5171) TaxID=1116229 RepID=S3D067_GLAL2|nr:uncharacterized protein GLAREA_11994 [Glarea lozoyensis ATCC 20868]EPE31912.1 hypothetical protein GLAREA_11994 [Glarea lozoyensis ATCC 20868]